MKTELVCYFNHFPLYLTSHFWNFLRHIQDRWSCKNPQQSTCQHIKNNKRLLYYTILYPINSITILPALTKIFQKRVLNKIFYKIKNQLNYRNYGFTFKSSTTTNHVYFQIYSNPAFVRKYQVDSSKISRKASTRSHYLLICLYWRPLVFMGRGFDNFVVSCEIIKLQFTILSHQTNFLFHQVFRRILSWSHII